MKRTSRIEKFGNSKNKLHCNRESLRIVYTFRITMFIFFKLNILHFNDNVTNYTDVIYWNDFNFNLISFFITSFFICNYKNVTNIFSIYVNIKLNSVILIEIFYKQNYKSHGYFFNFEIYGYKNKKYHTW